MLLQGKEPLAVRLIPPRPESRENLRLQRGGEMRLRLLAAHLLQLPLTWPPLPPLQYS